MSDARASRPVLVMGEALTDLVPDRDGRLLPHPGGAPANVATGLARLGVHTAFAGALGGDAFSLAHEDRLAAAGVNLDLAGRSARPTALAVASPTPTGMSYDFHLHDTATFRLTPQVEGLERFQAVYVGGLAAVVPPAADAVAETACAAADSTLLVVDPNVRQDRTVDPGAGLSRLRDLCALAHVVKASDEDIQTLWPESMPDARCRRLADEGRLVVLTRGMHGSTAFLPSGVQISVPAVPVTVVNTIGAGDAFMAGLLAGLAARTVVASGQSVDITAAQARDLLEEGARAAALVCAQTGSDASFRALGARPG
ncbi:PfkB family carbohydrate kinase [Streptomyces sp. NBC_01320]|uniref:PfkB family carbohydrate kinase n=1 Tax=Streptomyces sp. NBC_01320 TaxID=2903824 RepID=UPI002E154259|nr:PfkB family carbohydrate kinase [Streptomyces sp. NBC_01320]